MRAVQARPITAAAFAPFGDVVEVGTVAPVSINAGLCDRFSDLASLDTQGGKLGLSLFQAELRALPYTCDLLERHPLGSQCFVPMSAARIDRNRGNSAHLNHITKRRKSGRSYGARLKRAHRCCGRLCHRCSPTWRFTSL